MSNEKEIAMKNENIEEKKPKKDKKDRTSIFGRNLAIIRKAHHLTQEQVADILKIKRSTYAYYERDITPTLDVIKKLSVLFNTSVHFLLYGTEETFFEGNPLLNDPNANKGKNYNPKDLKNDERLIMYYYRMLSSQQKEKTLKDIRDLWEKAE